MRQSYTDYLESSEWKAKRQEILKRDKFLCQRCKKRRARVVHHKTYKRVPNELRSDLVSLCKRCHSDIHNVRAMKWIGGLTI